MENVVGVIKQICNEKGLSYEAVLETIEMALASAYRKDFGQKNQNLKVKFEPATGDIEVWDVKTVVADEVFERTEALRLEALARAEAAALGEIKDELPQVTEGAYISDGGEEDEELQKFNPKTDIILTDARDIKKDAAIGDEIKIKLELPGEFGRVAAETAKQVITQRLKEAERELLYEEYKDKVGLVIIGQVQRVEGRNIFIDLNSSPNGRQGGLAILPAEEQIRREFLKIGDRVRVLIVAVNKTSRGAEVIVSRIRPEIVADVFRNEIPEITSGVIEIKGLAREAGARSKIAVFTEQENIDPIGSCVGQRGTRIQTIIAELGGEKLDIIEYKENPTQYVASALLPAKVTQVKLNEEDKIATVLVAPEQLSLVIGRGGENVRLAAKLTGWKINIEEAGSVAAIEKPVVEGVKTSTDEVKEDNEQTENVEPLVEVASGEESEKIIKKAVKKTGKSKKSTSTEVKEEE